MKKSSWIYKFVNNNSHKYIKDMSVCEFWSIFLFHALGDIFGFIIVSFFALLFIGLGICFIIGTFAIIYDLIVHNYHYFIQLWYIHNPNHIQSITVMSEIVWIYIILVIVCETLWNTVIKINKLINFSFCKKKMNITD